MIRFIIEIHLGNKIKQVSSIFISKPGIKLHLKAPFYEFIAWGDPISSSDFQERLGSNPSPEFIVNNLYGHYYYVHFNKNSGELLIGNSLFSILPLYYQYTSKHLTISDNAITIGKHHGIEKVNRQFLLEMMLFNYPLLNESIFEDIHLLPTNSFISISGNKFHIGKHTEIKTYFVNDPISWRKAKHFMPEIFLETTEKYLPSEPYVHALTGGFDGRTLVAAGLYHKRKFSTYSFGSKASKDVNIAHKLSQSIGLPFIEIDLSQENYLSESSLDCGKEFIFNASGTATFARAHYLYAAKALSSDFRHMVTGNFGSEVFRAVHNPGVVISKNLYTLFELDNPDKAFQIIESSPEFQLIKKQVFKKEWEFLKEEMKGLPCFSIDFIRLSKNQRFYIYVFEEIFRKYFGAEMINQFHYLKNRTPFLDIDFLKSIFNTGFAGIHSGFFEHNPVKRFKGQVLYAHIIRKAYPVLGKILTDKGYKPDDLFTALGVWRITWGYFKKIIGITPVVWDPYGVERAWLANRKYWQSIPINDEYFNINNKGHIKSDILYKIISLSQITH